MRLTPDAAVREDAPEVVFDIAEAVIAAFHHNLLAPAIPAHGIAVIQNLIAGGHEQKVTRRRDVLHLQLAQLRKMALLELVAHARIEVLLRADIRFEQLRRRDCRIDESGADCMLCTIRGGKFQTFATSIPRSANVTPSTWSEACIGGRPLRCMKTIRAAVWWFGVICSSAVFGLHAEDYPARPIRLVIPWPPGGITDVIARGLGATLSDSLGQQLIPDNRPGAAGTLGVAIAAKANPDGYTLLMTDVASNAITASLYSSLPYDPLKDLAPIALPARSPLVLVATPKLGVKSIQQLIEAAKARPGQLSVASSGAGSITHLTAERFMRDTGTNLLHDEFRETR